MVTSSRRPDSWVVPGGGVEPEEEPAVTALREVREEAGVTGQLGRCLGVFEVFIKKKDFNYLILIVKFSIFFLFFLLKERRAQASNTRLGNASYRRITRMGRFAFNWT